jgi:hypothetical protein
LRAISFDGKADGSRPYAEDTHLFVNEHRSDLHALKFFVSVL